MRTIPMMMMMVMLIRCELNNNLWVKLVSIQSSSIGGVTKTVVEVSSFILENELHVGYTFRNSPLPHIDLLVKIDSI